MPRRELLTSTQRDELLAFPTEEADLLRYYTFNTHDLAVIRRRRGDHNRLGFAVQLCYARFPGRLLAVSEPPYAPILAMAAAQLKVPTGIWSFYAERDQTRREHLLELQEQFGYQAFTVAHYRRFALELAILADQTHQGMRLAQALVESLRKAKIIIPGVPVLERLCAGVIVRAQRRLYRQLTTPLSEDQKRKVEALSNVREGTRQTLGFASPPAPLPRAIYWLISKGFRRCARSVFRSKSAAPSTKITYFGLLGKAPRPQFTI
jgi:Domain of unknown function (DUF4158)